MEFEEPKNLAAVEGYNATLLLASHVFYSLVTIDKQCSLHIDKTELWLDEQFNPDCECWLDNRTIFYHDAYSSSNANECCRSIITLHILPHVDETLVFTCFWREEYYSYPSIFQSLSISKCK